MTNAEYSAQTQGKLLQVARREFARVGYADAGTERIVKLAHMTRGALYHHYADKRALFEAVFEELASEIAERITHAAGRERDPFAALVAGCDAWLDSCLEPAVRQIVLLDAPAVLGWRRWSEIDARHGTRTLHEGIVACAEAGLLRDADPRVLTRMLAGAMNDVALMIAESKEAKPLRRKVGDVLHLMLDGLRAPISARPARSAHKAAKR
ncbi:MAG: TetR/AcrR family transcriptional regulator, partial [Polyangiales bacterium]